MLGCLNDGNGFSIIKNFWNTQNSDNPNFVIILLEFPLFSGLICGLFRLNTHGKVLL